MTKISMKKRAFFQLPIRSKVEMINDVVQIMHCLIEGKRTAVLPLLEDLKSRSLFLDEDIQCSVLMFSEQIQFQAAYDPILTQGIKQAADRLLETLGFSAPKDSS